MSQPYVGEIRLYPYARGAPSGWFLCDGSLKQISQYEVLYTLIGTTYGGDGQTTFAVPDLRGRVPIHQGHGNGLSTYTLGQIGGQEEVTLTTSQLPAHTHIVLASSAAATSSNPSNMTLAAGITGDPFYNPAPTSADTVFPLAPNTVGPDGGNQPHDNCAPTLTLNYCISWTGIFPSQS